MLGKMWRYDYQSRGQYTASTDLTAKKTGSIQNSQIPYS